jgi:NAD(P)-dependent dehydrogenase (short-subunit alcohol dehydrogenase family)
MNENKDRTWLVTGAGRGFGAEIVRAALAAGDNVVATGRDRAKLATTFTGHDDRLLCVELDVTNEAQAVEAVAAAVGRFGGIDVLVNNAGFGQMGMFEDNTQADAERQFDINFFGVLKVTRAVLPVMRKQRGGRIMNISSYVGVQGFMAATLYCASKFAVEGFSEGLAQEVAPFGIRVTLVEPGVFRTDFMEVSSIRYGSLGVADYAEATAGFRAYTDQMSGKQEGDPTKLAAAILELAASNNPPLHFAAGSDAVEVIGKKLDATRADLDAWRTLSTSLAIAD